MSDEPVHFALGASLPVLKAAALRAIDAAAELARQSFLTPGSGQALEYSATETEARAVLAVLAAGGTPDSADYPFVQAEVLALAATGQTVTLADAAAQVVVEADGWKAVGSAIKEIRRAAKMRVEQATTAAEVQRAVRVVYPTAG